MTEWRLSHFASAYALTRNKVLFFFTYSILTGIALGLAFGLVLQTTLTWFPKRNGLVVGICTVGSGLGMFDDKDILNRTPESLQASGIVVTILAVLGISIFRQRKVESSDEEENYLNFCVAIAEP
ncbi:hypothetical protein ACTXT7_007344 [Hymenolepis weldensis]